MAVRITVDLPERLHHQLRRRAKEAGTSIRALVIRAIEERYTVSAIEEASSDPRKGRRVTGPMISGGKRGPAYPRDENPHDLVFS